MARKFVLGPNAARKLAELIRGSGEVSRRPGATAALAFDSEYVAPFTVQWAQSADSGGAWIIWLPGSDLVVRKDETLDPTSELSDVGGDYPDGWYVLTGSMLNRSSGGTLYLILEFGEEPSATFDAEADEDESKLSIPICEASVDSETGERKVRQLVTSAIVLDGGDEPDDVSIEKIPDPESGSEPDGDEGKLQIKGFKAGTPADTNTLADYLQGAAEIPSEGIALVARLAGSSTPSVVYIPLAAFSEDTEDEGKTISDVEVVPSTSETTVTFTYTDGSTTEIHIPHGLPGGKGDKGDDGDTPEITAEKNGGITQIFADGALIASISDGATPVITAKKASGVTTIYANGVAIAQINDGSSGSATLPDKNVVDDVSFSISGGKLKATLAKSNLKTGATSSVTKDVCDVSELDVVTEEKYSTNTHQFTNTRKRIKVIGTPSSASGQTPFTATPLSNE